MFTDLETERLKLKCIAAEDADFFYQEFSSPEVNRYLYDTEPCGSVDEAMEWIRFYCVDEPRDRHRWILVLKETNEKIGTCGFHCWDQTKHKTEMGYDLLPEYWRRGYMSEALSAILSFAERIMKLRSIDAHISIDNAASIRLAEKMGFVNTSVCYDEIFRGDRYLHRVYRLNFMSSKDLVSRDDKGEQHG